jgi:hypothetical protein
VEPSFASGAYDPELVKVMGASLEAAWAKFDPPPKDRDLARLHLASAIIDAVEAGEREPEALVQKAGDSLKTAMEPLVANKSLSFGVDAAFRREFKSYALSHGLNLNELLRRSFESLRREQGD